MDPAVRAELLRLETALASRDAEGIGRDLPSLIADDFVEHGASGAVWDVDAVRRLLGAATPDQARIEDFVAVELALDVVLVTYRIEAPRPSNRVSIWVRRDGRWMMRFHQGTLRPG